MRRLRRWRRLGAEPAAGRSIGAARIIGAALARMLHALHALFHARLAVAHALAEPGALLGRQDAGDVEHRLRHAPAHLVVLLQHLLAHLLDRGGVDRRRGERLHRRAGAGRARPRPAPSGRRRRAAAICLIWLRCASLALRPSSMRSIIRPMRSGEPRNIMPPPMPSCMPPMPWCSPQPCMPPMPCSPRCGSGHAGPRRCRAAAAPAAPTPTGSAPRAASSAMPIITHRTRRAADADAAIATALLISSLLRPTVGDGNDRGAAS